MTPTIYSIIEKSAEAIEQDHGKYWCQHREETIRRDYTQRCAWGWLLYFANKGLAGHDAKRFIERANRFTNLVSFNDAPGRRPTTVARALRRALEVAE